MNLKAYTEKALQLIGADYVPADKEAGVAAYSLYGRNPGGAGTIICENCQWANIISASRKIQLKEKRIVCRNCGARFTGIIKS